MIKKNSFIIVLCSLITFSLTHAMDKPIIDPKELPRLAVNLNAPTIAFLGNTHLLAIEACKKPILINITTGEDKPLSHKEDTWGVKTNSDKTKAIISGKNTLIVYDSQEDKTYTNDTITGIGDHRSVFFTDITDTVAIRKDIGSPLFFYNYVTKKITSHTPFDNIIKPGALFSSPSLMLLPIQQKLMFASINDLYIYNNVNDHPQELNVRTITLSNELVTDCSYNNDNSLMAFVNICTINILNIESGKKTILLELKNRDGIPLMQFHPSGAIFTTVLNGSIDYWHTKTGKHFAQQSTVLNNHLLRNYLSFSANGALLAVAVGEILEILKVPFETMGTSVYPLKTKERMITLLCLLKNFQHNNQPLLPEIAQLLVQKTLAVSELTGD